MEQSPVTTPDTASITNSGLLFLYNNNETNNHGFFGLLNDINASQFTNITNQYLYFGLRLPPPYGNGTLLTTYIPWKLGDTTTFYLEIVHNGNGLYSGYVNGQLILSGQITPLRDAIGTTIDYNQFGIRVGEGSGRCLYQQLILTEGMNEHRGDK